MKKRVILLSALAVALTGCLEPSARSMGATLMPAPLTHKVGADSSSQKMSVDVSGFWGYTDDAYNVRDLNAGGGNVGFTYRFAGSPLFVNVAAGGFGGSLKFSCDEEADCSDVLEGDLRSLDGDAAYVTWLSSKEGRKSYNFWNIQERVLAGADINPGVLILGLGGGIQFFQGSSDYDDMREKLDNAGVVNDVDSKSDFALVMAYWFGARIGQGGKFGNIVAEYDVLHQGDFEDWTSSLKLTYTHPTGFYAGAASNTLMSLTVFAGKQFEF